MPDAIILEHVTKQYGAGRSARMVLDAIDLRVAQGEFVSLMGPSGSGKTTLLNLVAGLDTPSAGRIAVAGEDLATMSDDARSDLRMRAVGMVFQSFNLFPTFSVEENVAWPLGFLGVRHSQALARAREILDQVEIEEAAFDRRPGELSGGEQQRVAIARALVAEPQLLLADEPTGNLDVATGQLILDLLRRLNRQVKLTVLMVTHNAMAATYGHRTVELRDGRIVREVAAARRPRVVPIVE